MIISVFVEGFPTTQPGYSCGVLKNGVGSEWSNKPCSEKHGYICQKGHSVATIPPGRLSNHFYSIKQAAILKPQCQEWCCSRRNKHIA